VLFLRLSRVLGRVGEDLLPSFAGTHYAVAPDLRGFNLSSQPAEVAAVSRAREIVGDLERFVAHLGRDARSSSRTTGAGRSRGSGRWRDPSAYRGS